MGRYVRTAQARFLRAPSRGRADSTADRPRHSDAGDVLGGCRT